MNGTGDRREVEARIQGYLDGSLGESESQRLLATLRRDPDYVEVILDGLRTDCLIRTVLGEVAAAGEMVQKRTSEITAPSAPGSTVEFPSSYDGAHGVTRPTRKARRWPQMLALAASVALLLGLSIWFFAPTLGEPLLAHVRGGDTSIERGTEFIPASDGIRLHATDILHTGSNGAATVTFGLENTKIEVRADTRLKLSSLTKGKRFELRAGKIDASVTRQRPFRPMVIVTPEAEARVLGTHFTLATYTNATRLEVVQGKVQFTRASDGKVVKVRAGNYIVAAANYELSALPQTGRILYEYWTNFSGVFDPNWDAKLSAHPDGVEDLARFEAAGKSGDNFGERIRGYLHPPKTGDYTFWIAGDGFATFSLSRDDQPRNKVWIATASHAKPREWTDARKQQSSAITLTAGCKYYIEAVQKPDQWARVREHHLALAWQGPDRQLEVIPGEFLSPFETKTNEKKGKR